MTRSFRWSFLTIALTFVFVGTAGPGCERDGGGEETGEETESTDESGEESAASGETSDDEPSGERGETGGPLLVKLEWSAYADLDLQVETPKKESGERETMTFGNPGPGGGEIRHDDGCSAHRCKREDSPYHELAYWDEGRDQPLTGKYTVKVLYHGNQPAEPREEAEFTVEAYEAHELSEDDDMEPFSKTSGTLGPSDDEVLETVGSFTH